MVIDPMVAFRLRRFGSDYDLGVKMNLKYGCSPIYILCKINLYPIGSCTKHLKIPVPFILKQGQDL